MRVNSLFLFGSLIALAPALAACGGGSSGVTPIPPAPVAPPPPAPLPPPPPPNPQIDYNTAEYQRSNAATAIKALSAYNAGATGEGIIVGVVDSGVNPALPEFSEKISSFSQDVAGSRGLGDEDGHGTSVAAVILAARNNADIQGVAFGANLLALRTDTPGSCQSTGLSSGCSYADSNIARAIDVAIANRTRVINLSFGGSTANSTLRDAINRATAAGIIIVVAAGNNAGADPNGFALIANESLARGLVIVAGGVDAADQIAIFSNGGSNRAGSTADHYVSALATDVRTINGEGAAVLGTGTSYSAPAISGAVALLAHAFPNLTSAQIVTLLLTSARDLGVVGIDAIYGNGVVDLSAAFAARGPTSVAGTTVPVSMLTNGTLSVAMGDASQNGLSTLVLDSLGRAYRAELSNSFSRAWSGGRLSAALGASGQTAAAPIGQGSTGLMLSVAGKHAHLGPSITSLLSLSERDRIQARALAGWIVTRLSGHVQVAGGVARSGTALVNELDLRRAARFLMAEAGDEGLGFFNVPGFAGAARWAWRDWSLTLSADKGDVLVWNPGYLRRYERAAYGSFSIGLARQAGPLLLDVNLRRVDESGTVLGARFGPMMGSPGSVTHVAAVRATYAGSSRWRFSGRYQRGWTHVPAGGVRPEADQLVSSSWALDAMRSHIWRSGDELALRVSQPLRVASGGFNLSLPTSWDYGLSKAGYTPRYFGLAPKGREVDAEILYSTPLSFGVASASLFARKDPGHYAQAPDDVGFAFRLGAAF